MAGWACIIRAHSVVSACTYTYTYIYTHSKVNDLPATISAEQLDAGVYMYLLRLNDRTLARVNEWMQQIIPCDFDPESTIALPIRASDKCIGKYRLNSSFEVSGFSDLSLVLWNALIEEGD